MNEQLSIECLSHVHVFACLRLCLGPFRRLMYNIDVYVFGFFFSGPGHWSGQKGGDRERESVVLFILFLFCFFPFFKYS